MSQVPVSLCVRSSQPRIASVDVVFAIGTVMTLGPDTLITLIRDVRSSQPRIASVEVVFALGTVVMLD